jgi:hypothetical protein
VLMEINYPGGEWSRKDILLVDIHRSYGGWSRLKDGWWIDILPVENVPG